MSDQYGPQYPGSASGNYGNDSYYNFTDEPEKQCREYSGFTTALLVYSIAVLFLYFILQRRINKPNWCCGYFGLPIPVNMIYETKDRWAFAAAFGALTGTFVNLIFGSSLIQTNSYIESIIRGFILFFITMFIPLLYFALLASIHAKVQILSHLIGFFYAITLFVQLVLSCVSCDSVVRANNAEGFYRKIQLLYIYGTYLPIMICTVVIGTYFVVKGVMAFIQLVTGQPYSPKQSIDHHAGYVRRLLRNQEPLTTTSLSKIRKIVALIKGFMYQWDPYFRYSVRVLSITSVVFIGLFVLSIQLLVNFVSLVRFAEDFIVISEGVGRNLINLAYVFAVIIPLATFIVVAISYSLSVASYRRHCMLIWKGDYSFLPVKRKPPARIVVASTFYFGWQIGMILWAWIFYVIIFVVAVLAVVVVALLMIYSSEIREWLIRRAILLLSSFLTGFIISFGQVLFVRFFFTKKNSLLVSNSRSFHFYNYFLLFYNALVGMGKALRRIATSAVVGLLFLPRMDRSLVIHGLEFLDKGYLAYLAFLQIEAAHNNPVLNVFLYLITNKGQKVKDVINGPTSVLTNSLEMFSVHNHYGEPKKITIEFISISRPRKMWHLAYTLVRNPELIELRRRDVDSQKNFPGTIIAMNELCVDDDGDTKEEVMY